MVRTVAGQVGAGEGFEGCVGRSEAGAPGEVAQTGGGDGAPAADADGPETGDHAEEETGVLAVPTANGGASDPGAGARDADEAGAAEDAVHDAVLGGRRQSAELFLSAAAAATSNGRRRISRVWTTAAAAATTIANGNEWTRSTNGRISSESNGTRNANADGTSVWWTTSTSSSSSS